MEKMEVTLRYQVLNQSTIQTLSYHPQSNILATAAINSDSCSFYCTGPDMTLVPMLTNESRPPGQVSCISWSCDGNYLALGHTKVEIWKFDHLKFSPYSLFAEDFIEVKNISWSPNSTNYLCSGITKSMKVFIRNIFTKELQFITLEGQVISSIFDQFGKYIVILTKNNILHIYDAQNLNLIKNISMAHSKHDVKTMKDRKVMSWSPDYTLLACPNLNDSKVSTIAVFDREKDFSVKNILIGHKTPVNCMKFSPYIYEYQGEKVFILATGDSSGTLSLWRIGSQSNYSKPFFISSSPVLAEESIEEIQWNYEGNQLFLHLMKKYIAILSIKTGMFGRQFSQQEKREHIQRVFGVAGATHISGKSLAIFGMGQDTNEMKDISDMPEIERKFVQVPTNRQQKVIVKTPQRVFTNGQKKKEIIPSRHIEKAALVSAQRKQEEINDRKAPALSLKPLKYQANNQNHRLNQQSYLEIKPLSEGLVLKVVSVAEQVQVIEERLITGIIQAVLVVQSYILVVIKGTLNIFDWKLQVVKLPIFLGSVAQVTANDEGDVFCLLCDGTVRGLNFINREFICEASINGLLQNKGDMDEPIQTPLSLFVVYNEDNHKIHIELQQSNERYFFDKRLNSWILLQFDHGYFAQGHSLRLKKYEHESAEAFYSSLKPNTNTNLNSSSSTMQYQLQLLYYRHHCHDEQLYAKTFLQMILSLKRNGREGELRKFIQREFFSQLGDFITERRNLWERVKVVGGPVIQEFILMEKLSSQ